MIRKYISSDKPELLSVLRQNVPKFFALEEVQDFSQYLELHGDTYLTIVVNEEIIGGAGYVIKPELKTGSITWIFCLPSFHGQRIGSQLLIHCHQIFEQSNDVEKYSVRTSQWAYQFFERYGYKTILIKKDYWSEGFDLYEMELDIKSLPQ